MTFNLSRNPSINDFNYFGTLFVLIARAKYTYKADAVIFDRSNLLLKISVLLSLSSVSLTFELILKSTNR